MSGPKTRKDAPRMTEALTYEWSEDEEGRSEDDGGGAEGGRKLLYAHVLKEKGNNYFFGTMVFCISPETIGYIATSLGTQYRRARMERHCLLTCMGKSGQGYLYMYH